MSNTSLDIEVETSDEGAKLVWLWQGRRALSLAEPASIEIGAAGSLTPGGKRYSQAYREAAPEGEAVAANREIVCPEGVFRLTDRWRRVDAAAWRVDRRLEIVDVAGRAGVRLLLELAPLLPHRAYRDFRYFAPPALYDLNDLNDDGVEDYLDTTSLHFREDRLTYLTLFAFSGQARLGFALSRADLPGFDSLPERRHGDSAFLQATDIGSLGIEPERDGDGVNLLAAYPFAERTKSHALLVKERVPFAAFYPAKKNETLSVSYLLRFVPAGNVHEAMAGLWRIRFDELAPRPVELPAPLDEMTRLRLEALERFFIEEKDGARAAGFVTNCHPQDGAQLSNVIQFGFTGQNNLNAFNLLRAGDRVGDAERRRKALRVMTFFVEIAGRSNLGLIPGFYNADTRSFGSWWTGLILPLAYAEPGADLEKLMGPLYQLLRDVIESLRDREGAYLRCVAEEYSALIEAFRYERERGGAHPEWLAASVVFGEFLLGAQESDGSWSRAYDFDGRAISTPQSWFGQTEVQQKSSTATVVPFLVDLHDLTGDPRFLESARRAGDYAEGNFVDRIRFNGGIHDSIYAKPQLVDGESIMFCMRALVRLYRATGEGRYLAGARRAADLVVTWIVLWDVPLPAGSTLARFGFRSTGWMSCDAPGAGYIHPMGVLAVPDLVEMGLLTGDRAYIRAAQLLQAGCNETVAVPQRDWGYAFPGLQEEGLLISWWFADDPMFGETGFGGRGKGEGNKTCLPWISAVSVYAYEEMVARYGASEAF
jgi:hypothetical protein